MADADRSPGSGTFEASTALIWGLVGAGVCAYMVRFEPNLLEEGLILHVAERMLAGEHLYRDVASFTGPLPFELLAALFRVFGAHIEVARAVVVVLYGLACGSIYALAASARAGALAHAAAACVVCAPVLLFPLLSLYFHTTLAFAFTLIAAWPALRALDSDRWAVTAGVLVGCAALCKQTLGVALALGVLAAVAACAPPSRRMRAAAGFVAGGAALAVVTLGFYALRGELGLLVHSIVVLPLSFDETFDTPFINFWPPAALSDPIAASRGMYLPPLYGVFQQDFAPSAGPMILITQILYALPFVALASTALRRLRGPLPAAVWTHAAVLAAITTNLFPRSDWGHVVFAIAPACVQLLLLAPTSLSSAPSRARRVLAAVCVGALLVGGGFAATAIWSVSEAPSLGPRVSLRPVTGIVRGPALTWTVQYLRDRLEPGDAIFVARAEPLLYFATGARNPTPYSGVIPAMREEQEATILEALKDVRFVVMSDADTDTFTWYREQLPAVQQFLERHFQVPKDFPAAGRWLTVLEPGPDRGPTAIDLFDRSGEAHVWIRDYRDMELPSPEPLPKLATKVNRRPLVTRLGSRGGGLDFDVTLPEGAVFEAGVGMRAMAFGDEVFLQADRCRFQLSVSTGGPFTPVAERNLHASRRRWTPFRAELSRFGGQRVTLRLEAVPFEPPFDTDYSAFWGSPRIATPD